MRVSPHETLQNPEIARSVVHSLPLTLSSMPVYFRYTSMSFCRYNAPPFPPTRVPSQTTGTDTAKSNTGITTMLNPASSTKTAALVQLQPTPHDRGGGGIKPPLVTHHHGTTAVAQKKNPNALSKPNADRQKSLLAAEKIPNTAAHANTATATVTPAAETNSLKAGVRATDTHRVVATVAKAMEQQPSSCTTNVVKTEVVLQPQQILGLASASQVESISTVERCFKKAKHDTAAAPSPSVHTSTVHRTHIKLERGIPPEALVRTSKLPETIHAPTPTIASSHSRWDALLRVCVAPLN